MRYCLFALVLSASTSAMAETPETTQLIQPKHIETVVSAKPINRVPPRYPVSAARKGQEGWVQVSFVVDENGDVIDPIVEDSSGIKGFEKAALKAVKKWKYDPANRNGEAIEQCETKVQLDFKLQGNNKAGVRRTFYNNFREVQELLAENNMEQALAKFDELSSDKLYNRFENAWFWLLDSDIAIKLDDKKRAVSSAGRAILSSDSVSVLGDKNYKMIVNRKFSIELEMQRYSDALKTFENLQEQDDESLNELVELHRPYVEKINDLIASDAMLVNNGVLEEDSNWGYSLLRNNFALTDIQGRLDMVDIRCQNYRAKYTAEADNIWSIPESWGECRVHITGAPNSQFKLVENPNV